MSTIAELRAKSKQHLFALLVLGLIAPTWGLAPQPFTFAPLAHARPADAKSVKWTCPMHPHYIADEFGSCPICGMDLVKLDTGEAEDGSTADSEKRTAITVSPEVIQSMGVRLAKVEKANFGRNVRSFGTIMENERLRTDITGRVESWVQDLYVSAVGDNVSAGTKLFGIYSPELVVTQGDLIRAKRDGDRRLIASMRERLEALGVQKKAIDLINKQERPLNSVPVYADRDGTVSVLNIAKGSYIKRDMTLARIQDYSRVWLVVSVAEKDLGLITNKTPTVVTFPTAPGRRVTGAVDYVYPTVDAATRTGKVRLVLDNSKGDLRPGTYADVTFEVGASERLAVSSEAVLRSETGAYVVVSLGGGRFEPRPVTLALTSGKWIEITSGLKAGEDVVVSGQFLLDSESALRESFRKLKRLALPLSLLKPNKTQMAMIDHVVDAALYLHEALIDGYSPEPKFLDPAREIRRLLWPRYKDTKLSFVLKDSARAITKAQAAQSDSEVKAALAELVKALHPWMHEGAPQHYAERKVAMFKEAKSGRFWIQVGEKALNPYGRGKFEAIPWPAPKEAPRQTVDDGSRPADAQRAAGTMPGHNH